MNFIGKYHLLIIAGLFVLLLGKSCQSCVRSNAIEFNKTQYTAQIDSLKTVNVSLSNKLVTATDSIKILNTEINALKEMTGVMQGSIDHMRTTNQSLVQTIKNNK